jgi:tripartite-type tricarboxylate transporter receptor subunit TctC
VEVQTYRALADMNTATFTFLVHPETPPEYVEALRASFVEMAESAEWKSRSADTFGAEPSVLAGEAAGVSGLGRVPEAVKEYIREASTEG